MALMATLAFVVLVSRLPLFGLNSTLDISQYAHTSSKIRDGFLKAFILSIAQTPDGYLWLGTERGLFRFDGVRAVPWQSLSHQQLPSSYVAALLATPDGTLWIGTGKGLASWKAGSLTTYPEVAGDLVQAIAEDHAGTIWVGAFAYTPPGALCAIRHSGVHCYGHNGGFGNGPVGLYDDSRGNLWVGLLNGFWRWRPGPPRFYPIAGQSYGLQHFAEDRDGSLLIPLAGSIARLRNGRIETAWRLPHTAHQGSGEKILRDRDGALWVGTWSQGLVHIREGRTDTFAQRDGLSGNLVTALFEDREGDIWVGTTKGLDRFRAYAVATFAEQEGLSSGGSSSVLAARDGSIWYSPHGYLYMFDKGRVTVYRPPGAWSNPTAEESERKVREVTVAGLPDLDVASLFQDHDGRIWIAGTGGVGYLQNNRFVRVNSVPAGIVAAICGNARGDLWISMIDRGLFHLFRGKLEQHFSRAALGHNGLVSVMTADPSRGGVWLGFSQGGLARLGEDQTHPSLVTGPVRGLGGVNDLYFDDQGALWIASERGLSRLKDGRISTLTMKNGLPCSQIYWLAEGKERSFWLYGSCGLIRIRRSDLDAWVRTNGRVASQSIQTTLFDEADGVTLRGEPSPGPQGRAAVSPDGRLWFSTIDGLSVIDPLHLPHNPIPPPVHIEQIIADGRAYNTSEPVSLPAHVRDLSIDYTALSLVEPDKVHFRYKLEGQDPNWREVLNHREVQYSNLQPGSYRFRVIACNNSGVWNDLGASLDFSIAPAYYQTTWFRPLCVTVFLALLWGLYQIRVRQIQRGFASGLEARVGERLRIARELHDTLLQSFQGIAFQLQAARTLLLRKEENAAEVLDEAILATEAAIQEGRSAIRDLRPEPAAERSLPVLLNAVGRDLATAQKPHGNIPNYRLLVEGTQQDLAPMLQDEVYRISREVIRNAFTHAAATQIEVEIRYDQDQLRLRFRDDGNGIDARVLAAGTQSGHFGIPGMRERAQRIGAHLDFWSETGAGTEVELVVPASMAYLKRRDGHRFRLFHLGGWR